MVKRWSLTTLVLLLLLGTAEAERFQWHGQSKVVGVEVVEHRLPFVLYDTEKVRASVTNLTAEPQTFEVTIRLTNLTTPEFRPIGSQSKKVALAPREAKEIVVDVPSERARPYGLFEAVVEILQNGEKLNFAITTYGYSVRPAEVAIDSKSPFATWLCVRGWIDEDGKPEVFGYPEGRDLSVLKTIGINNARGILSGWGTVERQKGTFDFRLPDYFVDRLHKAGIGATGILSSPPKWASSRPVISDAELRRLKKIPPGDRKLFHQREAAYYGRATPKNLDEWSNYVYQTVRHFKGRVTDWIIWNEPYFGFLNVYDAEGNLLSGNIQEPWLKRADAYYDLATTAYAAAKRANPECRVLVEAGYGRWAEHLFAIEDGNIVNCADVFVRHLYGQHGPDAANIALDIEHTRNLISKYGGRQEIWDTESGRTAPRRQTNRPLSPTELNDGVRANPTAPQWYWMRTAVNEWTHADFYVREMINKLGNRVMRIYDWVYGPPTMTVTHHYPTVTTLAATRLIAMLHEGKVLKRLACDDDDVFVWLIRDSNGEHVLACWRRNPFVEKENENLVIRELHRKATLSLHVGAGDAPPPAITVEDIFGNRLRDVTPDSYGVITVDVNSAPFYLRGILPGVSIVPNLIDVETDRPVKGTRFAMDVTVNNFRPQPLEGTLQVRVPRGWQADPPSIEVQCPGQTSRVAKISIDVPADLEHEEYPIEFALNGATRTVRAAPKAVLTAMRAETRPTFDSGWGACTPLDLGTRALVREGVVRAIETLIGKDMMPEDQWRGPQDLSASIRALWDRDHLYLKAVVTDNEVISDQPLAAPLDGDGLELFVDTRSYSKRPFVRTVFVPPTPQADFPSLDYLTRHAMYHGIEARRSPNGYILLITIPWADLGDIQPAKGMTVGIEIGLNDADADFRDGKTLKSRIRWSCDIANEANTDKYNMLILR